MRIKLLHLNIEKGRFLPGILRFAKKHNFDVMNFQEVTGGNGSHHPDCFHAITSKLHYQGELAITRRNPQDKKFYTGNATFYKPSLQLLAKNIIWLKRVRNTDPRRATPQTNPRCVLNLTFQFKSQPLHILNTHLAWGPNPMDRKYKLVQGQRLYQYLKSLTHPFVLSGDFNVTPDSQIVRSMNKLGRNLTSEHKLTNTLNSQTHRVPHLFPPGLAVDFVFASRRLKVRKFQLIDQPNLSDHLGLITEIEI